MDLIPEKCRCCRKSRTQKCIDRALKIMEEETNIVEITKSRRYFKQALQILLPQDKRLAIREEADFYIVKPSDEEDGESSMEGLDDLNAQRMAAAHLSAVKKL